MGSNLFPALVMNWKFPLKIKVGLFICRFQNITIFWVVFDIFLCTFAICREGIGGLKYNFRIPFGV